MRAKSANASSTLRAVSVAAILAVAAGSEATAVTLGAWNGSQLIGRPLAMSIPMQLTPDEAAGMGECASAEVTVGDRPVARSQVRASVVGHGASRTLVVATSAAIDEPVVTVQASVGCSSPISRRYTLFADPPEMQAAAVVPPSTAPAAVDPAVAAAMPVDALPRHTLKDAAPALQADSGPALAQARANRSRAQAKARRARARAAEQETLTAGADAPPPAAISAERPARRSTPSQPSRREIALNAPRADALDTGDGGRAAAAIPLTGPMQLAAGVEPARAPLPDGPGARLRLDAPAVTMAADQALERALAQRDVAVHHANAATAIATVASEQSQVVNLKLVKLERTLETLRADLRQQRAEADRLRAVVQRSELQADAAPWLGAGLLGLAGLAAWLLVRLRRSERERQEQWWAAGAVDVEGLRPETSTISLAPDSVVQSVPAALDIRPGPRAIAPTRPAPLTEPPDVHQSPQEAAVARLLSPDTEPGAAVVRPPAPTPYQPPRVAQRDVSIEELLDVEQQADFFLAIGDAGSALELLLAQHQVVGNASPVPALKLLETYRAIGDEGGYERIRADFQDRFSAAAPRWNDDPAQGRSLSDHSEVIERIVRLWPVPMDVMAELETLIYRSRHGEIFDLPAYRDILFLYTLARDLADQDQSASVDVLLPLGAKHPVPASVAAAIEREMAPTAPADLEGERFQFDRTQLQRGSEMAVVATGTPDGDRHGSLDEGLDDDLGEGLDFEADPSALALPIIDAHVAAPLRDPPLTPQVSRGIDDGHPTLSGRALPMAPRPAARLDPERGVSSARDARSVPPLDLDLALLEPSSHLRGPREAPPPAPALRRSASGFIELDLDLELDAPPRAG